MGEMFELTNGEEFKNKAKLQMNNTIQWKRTKMHYVRTQCSENLQLTALNRYENLLFIFRCKWIEWGGEAGKKNVENLMENSEFPFSWIL